MTEIFYFLGYVFCFWIFWKILDFIWHLFFPKNPKTLNKFCSKCDFNSRKIDELRLENADIRKRNSQLVNGSNELNKLYLFYEKVGHVPKSKNEVFVEYINSADKSELKSIEGIGVKLAEHIIENRPYKNMNDLENKINNKAFNCLYWFVSKPY